MDTFNAVEVIGLVFFTFFHIAHGHAVVKSQPRAAMRDKTGFCKKERGWYGWFSVTRFDYNGA